MDRARRSDPDLERESPDFSNWYQIVSPAGVNPDELARALRQIEIVETAYVMRPLPPPVNPSDDPRYPNEGYLGAAPNGIDRHLWVGISRRRRLRDRIRGSGAGLELEP